MSSSEAPQLPAPARRSRRIEAEGRHLCVLEASDFSRADAKRKVRAVAEEHKRFSGDGPVRLVIRRERQVVVRVAGLGRLALAQPRGALKRAFGKALEVIPVQQDLAAESASEDQPATSPPAPPPRRPARRS